MRYDEGVQTIEVVLEYVASRSLLSLTLGSRQPEVECGLEQNPDEQQAGRSRCDLGDFSTRLISFWTKTKVRCKLEDTAVLLKGHVLNAGQG